MSPDYQRPALTAQQLVRISFLKKTVYESSYYLTVRTAFWGAELSISGSSG